MNTMKVKRLYYTGEYRFPEDISEIEYQGGLIFDGIIYADDALHMPNGNPPDEMGDGDIFVNGDIICEDIRSYPK